MIKSENLRFLFSQESLWHKSVSQAYGLGLWVQSWYRGKVELPLSFKANLKEWDYFYSASRWKSSHISLLAYIWKFTFALKSWVTLQKERASSPSTLSLQLFKESWSAGVFSCVRISYTSKIFFLSPPDCYCDSRRRIFQSQVPWGPEQHSQYMSSVSEWPLAFSFLMTFPWNERLFRMTLCHCTFPGRTTGPSKKMSSDQNIYVLHKEQEVCASHLRLSPLSSRHTRLFATSQTRSDLLHIYIFSGNTTSCSNIFYHDQKDSMYLDSEHISISYHSLSHSLYAKYSRFLNFILWSHQAHAFFNVFALSAPSSWTSLILLLKVLFYIHLFIVSLPKLNIKFMTFVLVVYCSA